MGSGELLTQRALNRALLARQLLLKRQALKPLAVIEHLVGMQAQIPKPPFVGLWTRLKQFERDDLMQLVRDKKVVRATAMRGTIHLLSTKDFLDFRPLLAPMLEKGAETIVGKRMGRVDRPSLDKLGRKFFGATPAPFDDFREVLEKEFPKLDARALAYTVRMGVPLVMLPDESPNSPNSPNSPWGWSANAAFGLAERWVGTTYHTMAAPLETMVMRYLAAFGPASPADFQTWSSIRGAKDTFEKLRRTLVTFRDEKKRELFDLPKAPRPDEDTPAPVRFLPEYDNIVLSHADRTRIVADVHRLNVIVKNLRVVGTFLVDGFVAGTYRTIETKKTAELLLAPFATIPKRTKAELDEEGQRLLRFLAPDSSGFSVRISRD